MDLSWLESNYGMLDHYALNVQIDYDKALVPLGLLEKDALESKAFGGEVISVEQESQSRRNRWIGVAHMEYERARLLPV